MRVLVELSRSSEGRLCGEAWSNDRDATTLPFSGTLELLRVLEELVPTPDLAPGDDR